jgi:hypothetical protein
VDGGLVADGRVALPVDLPVDRRCPPALGALALRCPAWSRGWSMVALISRRRRQARLALEL